MTRKHSLPSPTGSSAPKKSSLPAEPSPSEWDDLIARFKRYIKDQLGCQPLVIDEVYSALIREHDSAQSYCNQLADLRILFDHCKQERDKLQAITLLYDTDDIPI